MLSATRALCRNSRAQLFVPQEDGARTTEREQMYYQRVISPPLIRADNWTHGRCTILGEQSS